MKVLNLCFTAAFRHCFRKVGKQNCEPQPKCDLKSKASAAHSRNGSDDPANQLKCCQNTANLDHEHDGVLHHRAGTEFYERINDRTPDNPGIPNSSLSCVAMLIRNLCLRASGSVR